MHCVYRMVQMSREVSELRQAVELTKATLETTTERSAAVSFGTCARMLEGTCALSCAWVRQ